MRKYCQGMGGRGFQKISFWRKILKYTFIYLYLLEVSVLSAIKK